MFHLTDEHIAFISNDIRARGIERVSLQHDLLDHICCVVEHELQDGADFERFYNVAITRFFRNDLREIEEETTFLLTNKNHYVMKKTMIFTGAASSLLLAAGIVLKFLHLPGAAALIVTGICFLSFVFLPLMFLLRMRERQSSSDKAISVIGGLSAVLISLGVLFKIMHWPGANVMCLAALMLMLFVFVPVYFFTGFRKPETKVNTVVSSVLMFAGCALFLTLLRSPHASKAQYVNATASVLQAQRIVDMEAKTAGLPHDPKARAIFTCCDDLKRFLIKAETGHPEIAENFELKGLWLGEDWADDYFARSSESRRQMKRLRKMAAEFNRNATSVPIEIRNLQEKTRVTDLLVSLSQTQLIALQGNRAVAMK